MRQKRNDTETRNAFLQASLFLCCKTMSEYNDTSGDLKPSQELLQKIAELKDSLTTAAKMIKEAYDLAIRDGFTPLEARQFLTTQLPFLAERTIRLALPEEAKNQTKVRHTLPQKPEQKETNIVNITTKAEIKDAELVNEKPEWKPDPDWNDLKSETELEPETEDPKDIEIRYLKDTNANLEDALRKTQLFKPATELQLQLQPKQLTLDQIFESLPDDGAITTWKINRIAGNALKNRITAWQGTATKFYRIWMEEVSKE